MRTADGKVVEVPRPEKFPTVIEGRVEGGKLLVTVHDVFGGRVAGRYVFPVDNCAE